MGGRVKLYYLDKSGCLNNANAYRVEPVTGSLTSFRFLGHLKRIVEKERGPGMSLNSIITTTSGQIVFHFKKDYKYFMNKAKKTFQQKAEAK